MKTTKKKKIIYERINDLKPYPDNARKHTPEQIQVLANMIKKFGFIGAIIVDEKNMIIAGHARFEAAIKAGLKIIPTIKVKHITKTEIKAFRIADNKVDPPPINESMAGVNPANVWTIYRSEDNGKKTLYGGANHRIFAPSGSDDRARQNDGRSAA